MGGRRDDLAAFDADGAGGVFALPLEQRGKLLARWSGVARVIDGDDRTPIEVSHAGGQVKVRVKDAQGNIVLDTGEPPWKWICQLAAVTAKHQRIMIGTGWFAGPGIVVTAAHCLFPQDEGVSVDTIRIVPGPLAFGPPFAYGVAYARSANVRVTDRWSGGDDDPDGDYGAIVLDDHSLGDALGHFDTLALDEDALRQSPVAICGFPFDRDGAMRQYVHEDTISNVSATRLVYTIDTFGGQSGSPIFMPSRNFAVVGIHNSGDSDEANSGVRMTADVSAQIADWAR